jgi:hypothetical protein
MRTDEVVDMVQQALSRDGHNAVSGARRLKDELVWIEREAVRRARADGLSWSEIGRLLGISRQAAYERFSQLKPPFRPTREVSAADQRHQTFLDLLAGKKPSRHEDEDDPIAW